MPARADKVERSGYRWYRWLVFALLAIGYLLVYFHRTSPAVVALDIMNDLNAGGGLMGLLASAYFYPYAFMQIPAGLLSDTWGPRRTVTVFLALAGLASILFGQAESAGLAIFARVLVGLGVAMVFVPTMKILTRWFKPSEFAPMMGILMALGGVGVLSAATPLALVSEVLGWRGSFGVIGGVTLGLAVLVWFLVRNSPEEAGFKPIAPGADVPTGEKVALAKSMKMVLTSRRFWPLAIWFFFSAGTFFSFGGLWGGPFLMDVYKMTKAEAGSVLSMLAWAMIFGSPLLSFLSDRVFRSRKIPLVGASASLVALCLCLAIWPAGFSLPMLYVWTFMMSFCASAIVVLGFTATKELFPVEMAGTATGLVNLFPFLGGAVLQPVLGLVLESYGRGAQGYPPEAYGKAFMIYVAASVIALVAASLSIDPLRQQPAKVESSS